MSEKQKTLEEKYIELKSNKERKIEGRAEADITKIDMGVLRDFVKEETYSKWNNANPDAEVIQITAMTPDGYEKTRVMTLTSNRKGNLEKYARKYGKYPEVGMKIPMEFDGQFWNFAEL